MLLISATALAQQQPQPQAGSIRGVVFDREFESPLAAAQISIVETDQKATTTDQGTFVIGDVPAGKYTLVFAKDGYVRQVRADVIVSSGQLTDVSVSLTGEFTEMEEYVVQDLLQLAPGSEGALLQMRFESPALMDSISADLMSRAGAGDAASALRLVAGASVKDGKSAVIRGLPDRYVSSQMNGVRLPSADEDKRAVELDQFPSAVIESIQVSKTFTPDQQGDASGGAVNVQLKGIPDEEFFINFKAQGGHNTQVENRSDFLTYDGGGISTFGKDDGSRDIQYDNLGGNWEGAVGTSRGDAPPIYKWSLATGGMHEFDNGLRIGGSVNFFYERDASYFDDGIDDSYWVESPGDPMTPQQKQGAAQGGDFKTALYDVTQGQESVQWGGLATFGLEFEQNRINLTYLQTNITEDTATLAEDTRGKQYYFPGYDPYDPGTPGHTQPDAAPYLRLQTLDYTERTTDTLQLSGRHTLPIEELWIFKEPQLDWTWAKSSAGLDQPDKRQFGSLWLPDREVGAPGSGNTLPALYTPYKPDANFTLGNLQRIWKNIEEESDQYFVNLKLPFEQWSGDEGYLKFGLFHDRVDRTFRQESFSNFGDNRASEGDFRNYWSDRFPYENHPITESMYDVDYDGRQEIGAWYGMLDLPLTSSLNLIGGARVESTSISVVNYPEELATWFPPGSVAPTELNQGDADVDFDQDDVLPSVGLVFKPVDLLTLRASYNETVARQTFKELTPIIQQEFLGGPIFIGNPELQMSAIRNYDLRADFTPIEGGLLSVSWFRKDIKDPIEYVQKIGTFVYTTAENYPEGRLEGWEFEVRQELGQLAEALDGLSIGGNATLISSEVTLSDEDRAGFELPGIQAPMTTRDMTAAPDHLLNLYLTYDFAATGTRLGLFYTVTGDTLIAGAGQADGNFVPSVYAKQFDSLNLTVAQRLGDFLQLQFQAKNLTNPSIDTVYRSDYIDGDVLKTSYTKGIDLAVSIGGSITF